MLPIFTVDENAIPDTGLAQAADFRHIDDARDRRDSNLPGILV